MKKAIYLKEYSQNSTIEAICPQCHEELNHADLEMFYACPFCGCPLADDDKLDRFIMTPVVQGWIQKTINNPEN